MGDVFDGMCTPPVGGRREPEASAPVRNLAKPTCGTCGTDAYLRYDDFIPAFYSAERKVLLPSVVSYSYSYSYS